MSKMRVRIDIGPSREACGTITVAALGQPEVTKEKALTARHFHYTGGTNLGCRRVYGPRGKVSDIFMNVRASGVCKTWKRDAGRFRLPVKYGLYAHGAIEAYNRADFHADTDCRVHSLPDTRDELVAALEHLGPLPTSGFGWIEAEVRTCGLCGKVMPMGRIEDEHGVHPDCHADDIRDYTNSALTLAGEGYADGGEPYTDEELDIINKGL